MAKKKKEKELKKIEEEVKYVDPAEPVYKSSLDIFRYYEEDRMTGFTLTYPWTNIALRVLNSDNEDAKVLLNKVFKKEWKDFIESHISKFISVYLDMSIQRNIEHWTEVDHFRNKLYVFWFRLDKQWAWSASRLEFVDVSKDNIMSIYG